MTSKPSAQSPLLQSEDAGPRPLFDYEAVAERVGQTRASYAPTSTQGTRLLQGDVSTGSAPGMRRAKSQPVMPRHILQQIPLSPLFYRRYYMFKAGTMTSSAFNLCSATLGAGVLALPSAMVHSGIAVGVIALILICIATVYSVYVLVLVSEMTSLNTYEEMAEELLGTFAARLTATTVVLFCWGVAVMFVVVMGDFVTPLLHRMRLEDVVGRTSAMCVFWALIMFPLSLAREITSLQYSSFLGAVSTLLLAVALVINASRTRGVAARDGTTITVPWARWDSDALSAFSTFLFSFGCQPVVFKVYSELKGATVRRMSTCAAGAMAGCTAIYIVTGVCGAYTYGSATQSNILSNLGSELDEMHVLIAYFGMAITVTMVFPLTIFPTRDSVVLAMGYKDDRPCPAWLSSTIGGLLAFAALIAGILVPNIRVLFDVLGGVCGGTISFLLPGLFALYCGGWRVSEVGIVHVASAWVLTLLGAVMCILGTYCSIRNNFLS